MESWNTRFTALDIKHLRSPAFAHPVAFEPTALLDFAIREGRTSELIDAPVGGKHGWLATTDLSAQAVSLKALPSNALFRDFCAELEGKLPHTWISGTAASVCKDSSTGKFKVHYKATANGRERKVAARAVILATGPVGKWNVPAPFEPHLASRLVLHTEEMVLAGSTSKGTLSEEITRRCPGESARVLVIGGGISAAQAALAAFRAGHQVVLRSRRPLQTRAFDIGSEWLDVRTADRLRFEFLCLPMERRRKAVKEATLGGSVPANYMKELHRLAEESPERMRLEVDADIDCSQVCVAGGGAGGGGVGGVGAHVVVNGETFAMVLLATGVVTESACSPLYRSVENLLHAKTVDGLPCVDSNQRWVPGEDLFVLGANAVLELGPGGGNLMGAMKGARVVSNELAGLMWKLPDGLKAGLARTVFSNMYASLGDRVRFGDGSEEEIDVLAQQLHLSPQAETALRKARRARKKASIPRTTASRGTAGLAASRPEVPRDAVHITARARRASYW